MSTENAQGQVTRGWVLSASLRMEADNGCSCPDCLSLLQSKTPPRKNNWKQKHEALIRIMSQARQAQQTLTKERKVSDLPPLPPIENSDYVACTYCRRKFAPRVAERHIPKCKNIKNRPPPPPQRRRWWGSAQLYLLLWHPTWFLPDSQLQTFVSSIVSTLAASVYVQQVNSSGSWIMELVYFDLHPRLPHKRCPFPQHKKLRIRNSRVRKAGNSRHFLFEPLCQFTCMEQGYSEWARPLNRTTITIRFNVVKNGVFLHAKLLGTSKKQSLQPSLSHLFIFILVAAMIGNYDKNISLLLFSFWDVIFLDFDY